MAVRYFLNEIAHDEDTVLELLHNKNISESLNVRSMKMELARTKMSLRMKDGLKKTYLEVLCPRMQLHAFR